MTDDDNRDIVARLRWPRGLGGSQTDATKLRIAAADEIERLRAEVDLWHSSGPVYSSAIANKPGHSRS